MSSIEKEEINNNNNNHSSLNVQENKKEELTSKEISKNNNYISIPKYKKMILPSIKNQQTSTRPSASFKRKLHFSNSQKELYNVLNNKTNINNNINIEKEKLMIAKINLRHLVSKINEINTSYKRLLLEKKNNINILREAISSNDFTYSENLYKKIEKMLDDAVSNKVNNYNNYENKTEQKSTDNNSNNQMNEKDKNNISGNDNKINDNNNKDNSNNKLEKDNKGNINNDNIEKSIENNNDNQNNDKNIINEEVKHRHNYSMETRIEELNNLKDNSYNNNKLNDNTKINSIIINNTVGEENNLRDNEEELNKYQIENGLFEKSMISSKFYNIIKSKTELSTLKHKMIRIRKNISMKEEEITEIKNNSKMKNIMFHNNILEKKLLELHKIKSKNKEIEDISIPNKDLYYRNLKKELEYYKDVNKSALVESKTVNDDYISIKNEFDEKTKQCASLEEKNSSLKYKLNTLKHNELKKTIALNIMNQKIGQIKNIEDMIETQKKMISEREKEINELKGLLNQKINEYEKSSEIRDKGYEEMNNYERQLNSKNNKQKNEYTQIKNDIRNIDKLISKEIEIYSILNKNDKDLIHQMYYNKNKNIKEFLEYLKEEEKNQEKKDNEYKNVFFKNISIGKKFAFKVICKNNKK